MKKVIYIIILVFFIPLFFGCGRQNGMIKYGLYQDKIAGEYNGFEKEDDYYCYLRFYDDGLVLEVATTGEPKEIIDWFKRESIDSPYWGSGKYTIVDNKISFTIKSSYGDVDYEGIIDKSKIRLNSYSHINDSRGEYTYSFVDILLDE